MDGTCMKEKWVVAAKKADFNALGKKFGIDPVIARLIRNRDIIGEEQMQLYLHGTLSDIPDPHLLADADRPCRRSAEGVCDHAPHGGWRGRVADRHRERR